MSGDTFKRRRVSEDEYQCGCHWVRDPPEAVALGFHGDVLVECTIHKAAGDAALAKFERERKASA